MLNCVLVIGNLYIYDIILYYYLNKRENMNILLEIKCEFLKKGCVLLLCMESGVKLACM